VFLLVCLASEALGCNILQSRTDKNGMQDASEQPISNENRNTPQPLSPNFTSMLVQLVDYFLTSCISIILLLAVWLSGNALASINVVALRQTRLVLGWVTVCGRVNHFGM